MDTTLLVLRAAAVDALIAYQDDPTDETGRAAKAAFDLYVSKHPSADPSAVVSLALEVSGLSPRWRSFAKAVAAK